MIYSVHFHPLTGALTSVLRIVIHDQPMALRISLVDKWYEVFFHDSLVTRAIHNTSEYRNIRGTVFLDIPAQTCTESGCFGFGTEGSPSRRNCLAKNLSRRTVLSSVNIR